MTTSARASSPISGIAAILACSACWGIASVFTKDILSRAEPIPVLIVQLGSSAAFLWLLAFSAGRVGQARALGFKGCLAGLVDPGLSYILGMAGLALTSASSASLITSMQPIGVILLAWAILRERIGRPAVGAMLLGVAGLALSCGTHDGGGSLAGNGLVLLSTLSASAYCLMTRGIASRADPLVIAAAHQTAGLGLIAWFAGVSGSLELPSGSTSLLAQAALSGIVQYAMSLWLYFVSIRRLELQTAAIFLVTIPVFSIVTARLVLGERMSEWQCMGALLIAAALLVACRRDECSGDRMERAIRIPEAAR